MKNSALPKFIRILDDAVADLDAQRATGPESLLHQQRFQGRVQLLADVLQQHRLSELHGVLQDPHVIRLRQSDDV